MSVFTDEKEVKLVTKGEFFTRDIYGITFETRNKNFNFVLAKPSITLKSNEEKREPGSAKHFTAYTSMMYDEFYEWAGTYIDKAYLEWCVCTAEGEKMDRVEEMKYIRNFRMKLEYDSTGFSSWRIDFDYGDF